MRVTRLKKTIRSSVTNLFLLAVLYLECIFMGIILIASVKEWDQAVRGMTDRSHVTTNLSDAHFNLIHTQRGLQSESVMVYTRLGFQPDYRLNWQSSRRSFLSCQANETFKLHWPRAYKLPFSIQDRSFTFGCIIRTQKYCRLRIRDSIYSWVS